MIHFKQFGLPMSIQPKATARALLYFHLLLLSGAAPPPKLEYDVVIRGGRLLDGAGNPWVRGDLAIKDGRIARIGVVPGRGRREIDASGRYVSPGFIDMMDQSNQILPKNGAAENKLRMGVTTLIAGENKMPTPAKDFGKYFKQLEQQGIAVNFGTYYNSGQARLAVMGDAAGAPSASQLQAMREEVRAAMRGGALGLSSALVYPPESFQTTADLVELSKEVARCDGFYATHMRDEAAGLLQGITEAIEIGEKSGAKVEIFHLKAAYAPMWGKLMPQAVAAISAARARGVDVAVDVYPYTFAGTGLNITIPNWLFKDGKEKGFALLKDPKTRERLKQDVAKGSTPDWSNYVEASGGWGGIILGASFSPKYEKYEKQTIADIAKALNQDPEDTAWDIVLEALPNRATALFSMMAEQDVELALRQPWASIGSDASASEVFGKMDGLGLPHPRSYGTFPRILSEYVRKRGVLTLEDAVRKMTSWPATRMGLSDRGLLREGLKADITIFNLDDVHEGATIASPTAAPKGIDYVIVNGEVTLDKKGYTGARKGRVLRGGCYVDS